MHGILKYSPTPIACVDDDDSCILEFDDTDSSVDAPPHPAWGLNCIKPFIHQAMGAAATVVIHNHDDVSVQF